MPKVCTRGPRNRGGIFWDLQGREAIRVCLEHGLEVEDFCPGLGPQPRSIHAPRQFYVAWKENPLEPIDEIELDTEDWKEWNRLVWAEKRRLEGG